MNYKHGESHTRLHSIWADMKSRCLNKRHTAYKNYGDRGITICPEWTESYIIFRDWSLNNGYNDSLTINRKNNDGNYEPNNCNWATAKENNRNQRRTKLTQQKVSKIKELHNTGYYTQKELAMQYNVNESTISNIINNKIWDVG